MNNFYRWVLRKFLSTTKLRRDETIVIAFREELNQKYLEDIVDDVKELLGDKVVLIGGVDKIIVA